MAEIYGLLGPVLAHRLPLLAWCVRHSVVQGVLVYGGFQGHPIQDVVSLAQVGVRWIVTQDVDDMVLPFRQVFSLQPL